MQSVEPSKLKEKISQCNLVNSGDKDGIGKNTENLDVEQVKWKLYKVSLPEGKHFKLLGNDIEYVSRAIRKRFSNIHEPEESPYIQKR